MVRDTSALAYDSIKKTLCQRQKDVLNILKICPSTIKEISTRLNKPPNEISPRINELNDLGWIVGNGKRKDKVTGKRAIEWKVFVAEKQRELF